MTPRALVAAGAAVLLLAGCGGDSSPAKPAADGRSSPTAAGSPTGPAPGGSAAANTSGAAPARPAAGATTSTTTTSGSSGSTTTGTASDNGGATTTSSFTAPGTYTYDTSGTVAAGASKRDASGTATLTVDPPAAGRQHSLLGTDQGRTEQDVVVRRDGTYLLRLAITNPTFSKEFNLAPAGLLVPDPAMIGRSWSWTAKSTDGKTTAAVTARVAGRETMTIGGVATPTTVIESTLKLTGDITYTAQMRTWADLARRLAVKEYSKGRGTFGTVAFTTDITSVLRSTQPS